MNMKICSVSTFSAIIGQQDHVNPEEGNRMFLRNVGTYLPN